MSALLGCQASVHGVTLSPTFNAPKNRVQDMRKALSIDVTGDCRPNPVLEARAAMGVWSSSPERGVQKQGARSHLFRSQPGVHVLKQMDLGARSMI